MIGTKKGNDLAHKYVFVYGTLRVGLRNHHFISGQELICKEARLRGKYQLKTFFDRPFVVQSLQENTIKGELYQIDKDCLNTLDQLERHPHWYKRTELEIFSNQLASSFLAQVYLYFDGLEAPHLKLIKNGCFVNYMRNYTGDLANNYQLLPNGKIKKLS